jgi:WD40 repeat protein
VIVMTPEAMQSEMTRKEWRYARQCGVNVYPVKGCPDADLDYSSLPNWMRKAHFFDIDKEWETFVNYLRSDRQPSRVPFMAPDFPEGFVQRPREFEQLIAQLVDAKRESPIAITTALQGAGGYGKTTLAVALCHDERVIGAFDDGILWVTLGQSPNVLIELTKLYEALTAEQSDFVDETQAELKLREKLENRNCLLVIDDVWQRARLEPFLQGGKKTCARLITTRRSDLVMDAKRIRVDEMTPEESVAVLAARIPGEKRPRDLQPFRHLAARLKEWPLLLKLAAGVIGARLERGDTLDGALDYVNRAYDRRGLTAFDPKDGEKRNDAAAKSIEATLELLDKDERTRLSELAIFPEDSDVPLRMIELLWGVDNLDIQDTAKRLADFALLDLDLRVGIVRLHDEIRLFFVRAIGSEAVTLHARLVDRLGNPKEIQDGYALHWLPWHLGEAGRDTERRALLVDFEWMMAKLKGADIQSLIADYEYLPKEADLRTVQSAIRLSAHILARDARQLAGQLTGRLLGHTAPSIQALLKQAAERKVLPWLRPLRPSLTYPGGPLIRMLEGHRDEVFAVAVTADGRRAVSASKDTDLRIWDLASGQTRRPLEGHSGWVHAVAITLDGRRAVSGSGDKKLLVWDLESGQLLHTLEGHHLWVCAVAITPDGRRVVSASEDRTVRVWDLESGQLVRTLEGHTDPVKAVAITSDGCRVVSASEDRTVRVWDLESGQVRTLEGHRGRVQGVAITPDGHLAVSASEDKTLRVWNLESGSVHTLEGQRGFSAVAVTPDGRLAVSASEDRTVRVWDLESGQLVRRLEGHTDQVRAVAITPDGRLAVSASKDKTVLVWDLESGQSGRTLEGHADQVQAVAITPDGRCAVSASKDSMLRVWDLESGQLARTLEGHTDQVQAVAITPDGRCAVSASKDSMLRVWDLESGQSLRTLEGHTHPVHAVAITPDGNRAVSTSEDKTVRVWDMASGKEIASFAADAAIDCCAVSLDGRKVVSGDLAGTVHILRLEGVD